MIDPKHDAALDRCLDRLKSGTVEHRHIMPDEQVALILAAKGWRDVAQGLGLELMSLDGKVKNLEAEIRRRNDDAITIGEKRPA